MPYLGPQSPRTWLWVHGRFACSAWVGACWYGAHDKWARTGRGAVWDG